VNEVLPEKRPGYASVTLNRPEAMNALAREPRADFVEVFATRGADDTVRAIILAGTGKSFRAGFGLKEFRRPTLGGGRQPAARRLSVLYLLVVLGGEILVRCQAPNPKTRCMRNCP